MMKRLSLAGSSGRSAVSGIPQLGLQLRNTSSSEPMLQQSLMYYALVLHLVLLAVV